MCCLIRPLDRKQQTQAKHTVTIPYHTVSYPNVKPNETTLKKKHATQGVSPGMTVGVNTEVIAGEGLIITAGGMDAHVHFICPQICDEVGTANDRSPLCCVSNEKPTFDPLMIRCVFFVRGTAINVFLCEACGKNFPWLFERGGALTFYFIFLCILLLSAWPPYRSAPSPCVSLFYWLSVAYTVCGFGVLPCFDPCARFSSCCARVCPLQ